MKVILPMAGNGQRFFDDGYDLPKPLIDIKGKPMFARVIENLWLGDNVKPWCIVRQDHVNEYEIDKRILEHYPDAHIIIPVFTPNHNEPKHSYCEVDKYDNLLQLREKEIISDIATVGVYYFGDECNWIKAHEKQMAANDRTNNEFYLAPTYNYLEENVGIHRIDEMIGMGTPEELNDLKNSEYWDKLEDL